MKRRNKFNKTCKAFSREYCQQLTIYWRCYPGKATDAVNMEYDI